MFQFPEVQQQTDGSSCSLFSLAFAFEICDGNDPSLREYCQDNFRKHFHSCLIQQSVSSFACGSIAFKPNSLLRLKIFCQCRLPDSGDDMVKCFTCRSWYHYTCVGIQLKTKVPGIWNCINCSKKWRLWILLNFVNQYNYQ